MTDIAQNTSVRVLFRVFSTRNQQSDEIGATLSITLSKNGAAFVAPHDSSAAVSIGLGFYYKDFDATDTNTLGPWQPRATGTRLYASEPPTFYVVGSTSCAMPGDAMTLTSGERSALATAIWANATRDLTSYGTLVADVVSGVWGAGTRTLSSFGSLVSDIWAAVVDSGGVTTLLSRLTSTRADNLDNLNASVASRAAPGDQMTLTSAYDAAKTAAQAGDAMALTSGERTSLAGVIWTHATRTLTSYGSLVSDIWASVVDSAGVTTLLGRLTSGRATALDHLDVDISTRLAAADYTAPDNTTILAIKADTEEILTTGGGGGGGGPTLDEIKDKMQEALNQDLYAEPGQEDLPTPTNLAYMLSWLYKLSRNRVLSFPDHTAVYNDAGDTVDQASPVTFDETVFTREKFIGGP